jgi:hypothetical protein
LLTGALARSARRFSRELKPGWLAGALQMAFPPQAPTTRIEFRIGDEVASLENGDAVPGGSTAPDAVVIGEPSDFYCLVVDRDLDAVRSVEAGPLRALLATPTSRTTSWRAPVTESSAA